MLGFQNTKTFLVKGTFKFNWNMFLKRYLLLMKLRILFNTVYPWRYMISNLNGEPIIGSFFEKELQKASQEKFRMENVLKRKSEKMCVKWKGCENSFNNWIGKKELI